MFFQSYKHKNIINLIVISLPEGCSNIAITLHQLIEISSKTSQENEKCIERTHYFI